MKTFFISDLHFGHKNILKFEPKRLEAVWEKYYKTDTEWNDKDKFIDYVYNLYTDSSEEAQSKIKNLIELHDKLLIANWNSIVKKDDIVWFLGDFCLGGHDAVEYTSKLNGRLRLIKGNHDKKPDAYYRNAGFEFVSSYPIMLKRHFILMHAPMENFNPEFFYIYGHVHSSNDYQTKTTNTVCACIERHDLKPFLISEFDSYEDNPAKYPPEGNRE